MYATSRDNLESWYLAFVIPAALSVFMNTKFYLASDESRIARTIGYVTNGLCLTIGLFMVAFAWESNTAATVALILAVLALSGVNVKNVFTMFSNHWLPGVYTGIKFSLVIIVLLARFSAVSYVVSIVLILAALIFITAGFRFEQKSLRIYGLCVTLLCIFKLILFDISYDSDIMKPIGFFVAGILCFGISWIYSRLEKKMSHGDGVNGSLS